MTNSVYPGDTNVQNAESQHLEHQNNVFSLFEVSDENTKTTVGFVVNFKQYCQFLSCLKC